MYEMPAASSEPTRSRRVFSSIAISRETPEPLHLLHLMNEVADMGTLRSRDDWLPDLPTKSQYVVNPFKHMFRRCSPVSARESLRLFEQGRVFDHDTLLLEPSIRGSGSDNPADILAPGGFLHGSPGTPYRASVASGRSPVSSAITDTSMPLASIRRTVDVAFSIAPAARPSFLAVSSTACMSRYTFRFSS